MAEAMEGAVSVEEAWVDWRIRGCTMRFGE